MANVVFFRKANTNFQMNGLCRIINAQVDQCCVKPTRLRVNRGVDPQSQLRCSIGEILNIIKSITISPLVLIADTPCVGYQLLHSYVGRIF